MNELTLPDGWTVEREPRTDQPGWATCTLLDADGQPAGTYTTTRGRAYVHGDGQGRLQPEQACIDELVRRAGA